MLKRFKKLQYRVIGAVLMAAGIDIGSISRHHSSHKGVMNKKQMVTTLSLGLMGMMLLMFAGCDRFDLGMIDNNRDELDTVDPNLVRANTMFGFKLLNELRQPQQHNNTLLSPSSLSVALAMARNGAAGETDS